MPEVATLSLRRMLTAIAAAVGGLAAATITLTSILTAYQYEADRLNGRAEFAAAEVSKLVYGQPDTWIYQAERLNELLRSIAPAAVLASHPQILRILDRDGALISEAGVPVSPPTIMVRRAVTDGFTVIGMVELTEDVGHIWRHAIPASLIGLALAIAIFVVLRVLPMRALLLREGSLEAARRQTRDSEQFMLLVIDAMPVLIGYVDSDERLRVVNKMAEDWYGRPRADILGRTISEVVPEALSAQIQPKMKLALAGQPVAFENSATYPDGITRRVRGRYIPHVAADGQILGYFYLVEDVTARRETEQQLRQAQKAEAVGQLTGGIAHDFNNLLGIILGNVEILRDQHADNPESLVLIDSALNASLRGGELTQRLLAFSRRQILTPHAIQINNLVSNIAILVRRTIASSIQIKTVLAEDLWPAMVDAGQLENAIVNLSVNARDAMPKGGELTIETANTVIEEESASGGLGAQAPGSYVTITVSDSGFGMPPEVAARVFEPFFTTKEVGKGSGLGLSMVYGFAKQSGGEVKIYSEPGEGTRVRIYLPKANAETPAVEGGASAESKLPAGRGEIILVVEDAEDLRLVAAAHLRSLGYTVLQAGDGRTALTTLQQRPDVNLLFTDIVLPGGMNGGELAREAQARHPHLKVLFASGYSRNALVHQSHLDKDVRLIDKPYRRHDLAREVRATLDEPTLERTSA